MKITTQKTGNIWSALLIIDGEWYDGVGATEQQARDNAVAKYLGI